MHWWSISRATFSPSTLHTPQRILERIQSSRGRYNQKEWTKHAKEHDKYLKNICESPLVVGPRRTRSKAATGKSSTALKKRPKRAAGAGAKKHNALETPILKEGRSIGDKYVIVTVYEFFEPHIVVFRTYDLDTSEAERLDVPFEQVQQLLGDDVVCHKKNREELAGILITQLQFTPKLSLNKELQVPTHKRADDVSGGENKSDSKQDTAADPAPEEKPTQTQAKPSEKKKEVVAENAPKQEKVVAKKEDAKEEEAKPEPKKETVKEKDVEKTTAPKPKEPVAKSVEKKEPVEAEPKKTEPKKTEAAPKEEPTPVKEEEVATKEKSVSEPVKEAPKEEPKAAAPAEKKEEVKKEEETAAVQE